MKDSTYVVPLRTISPLQAPHMYFEWETGLSLGGRTNSHPSHCLPQKQNIWRCTRPQRRLFGSLGFSTTSELIYVAHQSFSATTRARSHSHTTQSSTHDRNISRFNITTPGNSSRRDESSNIFQQKTGWQTHTPRHFPRPQHITLAEMMGIYERTNGGTNTRQRGGVLGDPIGHRR